MDECRCGHGRFDHTYRATTRGGCRKILVERNWLDFDPCPCKEFDNARLPTDGERLEFGVHHLNEVDSEAPAWPVGESKVSRVIRKAAGLPPVRSGGAKP